MDKVFVEGHRGYCAKYPENTLISFEAAINLGVDGFEFDVWLSKDKIPVIMVDESVYRTCGIEKKITEMTLEEIKKLDAGYEKKFGKQYIGKGIQVPTLREVCELVCQKAPNLKLGVEIKDYTEECVDLTIAILKEYGLYDRAKIYAFDSPTLKYAKEKYQATTLGYSDFEMYRLLPDNYDYYDEIAITVAVAGSEIFPLYQNKGFPIHFYCADTKEDVQLCLDRGAKHITANDPIPLMTMLGRPIGNTT